MTSSSHSIKRFAIERDYSNGLLTQWDTTFPLGLDQYMDENDFNNTIQHLNNLFKQTESYTIFTCFEAFITCLSCYTLYICIPGQYERGKKKIELYIEEQNSIYPSNITWLNPFRNGLINIIIEVKT